MGQPKSVVVFDFDGTATHKGRSLFATIDALALPPAGREAQQEIHQRLLPKAQVGKLTAREDEYWLQTSIENYIKYGLSVKKARAALASVTLREGVRECLEMLRKAEVPVAIISYGIAPLIEIVLERYHIQIGMSGLIQRIFAAEILIGKGTGEFISFYPDSLVLQSTKGEWSRRFADSHGVSYANILAVGDTGGDRYLGHLQENRLAIAKDEAEAAVLAPFMGEVVVTEDFAPVTAWLRLKLGLV